MEREEILQQALTLPPENCGVDRQDIEPGRFPRPETEVLKELRERQTSETERS